MATTNSANDHWVTGYHKWYRTMREYEVNEGLKRKAPKIYNFLKTYEQQKTYVQKGKVL